MCAIWTSARRRTGSCSTERTGSSARRSTGAPEHAASATSPSAKSDDHGHHTPSCEQNGKCYKHRLHCSDLSSIRWAKLCNRHRSRIFFGRCNVFGGSERLIYPFWRYSCPQKVYTWFYLDSYFLLVHPGPVYTFWQVGMLCINNSMPSIWCGVDVSLCNLCGTFDILVIFVVLSSTACCTANSQKNKIWPKLHLLWLVLNL